MLELHQIFYILYEIVQYVSCTKHVLLLCSVSNTWTQSKWWCIVTKIEVSLMKGKIRNDRSGMSSQNFILPLQNFLDCLWWLTWRYGQIIFILQETERGSKPIDSQPRYTIIIVSSKNIFLVTMNTNSSSTLMNIDATHVWCSAALALCRIWIV